MDQEIKDRYALGDAPPMLATITLPSSTEGWLAPARMASLQKATETAASVPDVGRVTSLSNLEGAGESGNSLTVGRLTQILAPSAWRERFMNDTLIRPGLISADEHTATLVIDVGHLEAEKLQSVVSRLRERLPAQIPGAKVQLGGVPTIQSDMNLLLTQELYRFLILGAIACIGAVLLFFRNVSAVIICTTVIALSNLWAVAYLALFHIPFTLLLSTLPVLVSISALAMATHTLLVYADEARRRPQDKPTMIWLCLRRLALPNLLVVLTTSVGFAMLALSNVPVIRQYGWAVCFAQLLVWLACSLAMPALMFLLPIPEPRTWAESRSEWIVPVLRRRRTVLAGIAAVFGVAIFFGHQFNWSVRLFDDLPEGQESRASTETVDNAMGGVMQLQIDVEAPATEADAWNSPDRVEALRKLEAKWTRDPLVGSALGLPDFLAVAAKRPAGPPTLAASRAPAGYSETPITMTRKQIAETVFLYSLAEDNPLTHFLTTDGSATRVEFRLHDVPALKIMDTADRIEADFRHAFPGDKINKGGMGAVTHVMNQQISQELIGGLWQSLVIITVLLLVVFRSLRWAVIAAVPNLLAPAALLAMMSILHTPIKPGIALIFSIALGIAYNNTVYLLERLKQLALRRGTGNLPVARAWFQEGNPCLLSTLALFGGFAVFLSSHFALNRTFGAYMLLSLGSGLLGDLILLPVMLHLFPGLLPVPVPKSVTKRRSKLALVEAEPSPSATLGEPLENDLNDLGKAA